MQSPEGIRIFGVQAIPEILGGVDLADVILDAMEKQGEKFRDGDIVVVTQKIVSKAEGRLRSLSSYKPSKLAKTLANDFGKDPRHVQAILDESRKVLRAERGVIISETKHGFICANAGIDQSNIEIGKISLLPEDSDKSAEQIRKSIKKSSGVDVAAVISDTFGRPFREGHVNIAIGVAGLLPLLDYRGRKDDYGNLLKVTTMAVADELAAAAELVMGKLDRVPVAIVRGYKFPTGRGKAKSLVRPSSKSLFK